jgi:PBP1b-binding outer membrane lipoprotein LpoB
MNLPKRTGSFAIALAGAFAMIAAGCVNSDARARKAAVTKAGTAPIQNQQPERPIKMRYYGGAKSPMYPG